MWIGHSNFRTLFGAFVTKQVMEVINRADPIFDMYMRGYNLSIDSVWGHDGGTDVKYLTTRIVRELLPPMC